jgi:hypothetical protein
MSRDKGATADEMLAVLVKAFPDRAADGMRKTVLIQANKNRTSKEVDEKRGRIYYRRGQSRRGTGTTDLITPLRRGTPGKSLKGRREHLNLPIEGGIKRAEQRLLRTLALRRYRCIRCRCSGSNDAPPGNETPI